MTHYIALIDGEPGAWGLAFPDAPGCTAMGETFDEVHANGVEALREWMADRVSDGLAISSARDITDLLDEAAGRSILHVPLLLDKGRNVRANISMDAGLLEAIDAAATRRGLTRSAFLASVAREKIAAEG